MLAARQSVRVVAGAGPETNTVKRVAGVAMGGAGLKMADSKFDVFDHRQVGEQSVVLEHHTDAAALGRNVAAGSEYLAAIADPKHEQHEEMLEWRGPFDPDTFDAKQATKEMKRVK